MKEPKNATPIVDVADDPDAPVSDEERARAERLRDALADFSAHDDDADFVRALALAHAPRELDPADHEAIVARALAPATVARPTHGGGARTDVGKARPMGRVIRVSFGVAGALAAAAAVLFVVGSLQMRASAPPATSVLTPSLQGAPALVPLRSTQTLFGAPFAEPLSRGAASARIDRIAMAREGDLRENRFAMWGVR